MRDRRVENSSRMHMHGGGVFQKSLRNGRLSQGGTLNKNDGRSRNWSGRSKRDRWTKPGKNVVRDRLSPPPLPPLLEKNRSTDMRPGIIRWRLFSSRRSRLIEYPARKFVRIPIENGRSDVSIEMQGDDLLGFWTSRQGASEQRENKRGRGW